MDCPRAGSGRGIVHGRVSDYMIVNRSMSPNKFQMFTRDGKLIAVLSQEGVARANIRGPDEGTGKSPLPKL